MKQKIRPLLLFKKRSAFMQRVGKNTYALANRLMDETLFGGLKPTSGYTGPATGCGTEPTGPVLYQPQAADWVVQGSNVVLNEEDGVSIEGVDNAFGAQLFFDTFAGFETLEIGKTYNISCDVRVDPGDNIQIGFNDSSRIWRSISNTTYVTETWAAQTISTSTQDVLLNSLATGEKMYIRNWVIVEV